MNVSEDRESIEKIHPINASYLLNSQPHHLYGDTEGNLLELVIERFASTVVERLYGHGGIVAIGYHDAIFDEKGSFKNTFILRPDGNLRVFHDFFGEFQGEMDIDILYMLLNPFDYNGWIIQNFKKIDQERIESGKGGLGIELQEGFSRINLRRVIESTRTKYIRNLS